MVKQLVPAHRGGLPEAYAIELKLYRAKDVIERDFRLIKDVVELRPIYHHIYAKVRAHLGCCVPRRAARVAHGRARAVPAPNRVRG